MPPRLAALVIWTGVFAVSTGAEFFIMAALAGVVICRAGSYRLAALSLAIFFVIGFALLSRVDIDAAQQEAKS